jgi:hypothetical protein
MRQTGLAAILFVALSTGAAHAELLDAPDWAPDWYRRVEALAQSLIGGRLADHEVVSPPIIKPPGNIDPQMALVPPQPRGTARIIIPPGETGR